MSKLVSKAQGGLQIRSQDDVYQVFAVPVRPDSQPLYTTRSLERAQEWRRAHGRGRGRPPKPVGQRVRDAKPLYLRLTVEARASLDAAAQARGMSTEDYARLLLIPQFRGP